jgi:hypothetical protein
LKLSRNRCINKAIYNKFTFSKQLRSGQQLALKQRDTPTLYPPSNIGAPASRGGGIRSNSIGFSAVFRTAAKPASGFRQPAGIAAGGCRYGHGIDKPRRSCANLQFEHNHRTWILGLDFWRKSGERIGGLEQ